MASSESENDNFLTSGEILAMVVIWMVLLPFGLQSCFHFCFRSVVGKASVLLLLPTSFICKVVSSFVASDVAIGWYPL